MATRVNALTSPGCDAYNMRPENSVQEPFREGDTVSKRDRAKAPEKPPEKPPEMPPGRAPEAPALTPVGFDYRKLALATPRTEFETYARQKVKTAERLGQKEEIELMLEAFELGRALLAEKPEGNPAGDSSPAAGGPSPSRSAPRAGADQ